MEFRERLYQLRRQAGLSQEELAQIMNLSRQAVQKWESGASKPDMDNLTALADYFNVTLDYLVRGTQAQPAQVPPDPLPRFWRYEYKSRRTFLGLPLVHVNVGYGFRWTRGIIAVGNFATGLIAIGGVSAGLLAIGGIALGGIALGGIALGGLAGGGLAIGAVAAGGVAVGLLAIGASAIGRYALGASALGSSLAVGAAAASPLVEVGIETSGNGVLTLPLKELWQIGASPAQTAAQIALSLPHAPPEWLLRLLLGAVL